LARVARLGSFLAIGGALLVSGTAGAHEPNNDEEGLFDSRRNAIVRAAEDIGPAVVTVSVLRSQLVEGPAFPQREFFSPFFRNLRRRYWQRVQSIGSGVIVRDDAIVVTNYHVVTGAQAIKITLADGREFPARYLGGEELYDLAILQILAEDEVVPAARLGSSAALMIGEWVIAVGNPFGYLLDDPHPTVTVGVVSAVNRDILPDQEGAESIYKNMIQTDAAINPGNSGGALVNADGEVIGVNTFIFSQSGGSHGIGFAIPIDTVLRVMTEVLTHGEVREVWIGVRIQEIPAALAESLELDTNDGVIVASVESGSPAEQAGLTRGDVILQIGRERVRNFEDARRALYGRLVDDLVEFEIQRGSAAPRVVTLHLVERT
jgi:serine protease Do